MTDAIEAVRESGLRRFRPYAEYKDSGVEWLGEIPAHWDTPKLWRISRATSGGTPSKEEPGYWNGEIPWVSPKDMKRRVIDSSEDWVTERALTETGIKLIDPGAVLIVVRGMILAHSFPVALTTAPVTINQDMKAVRFVDGIDPRFVVWLFEGVGKAVLAAIVEEAGHGTRVIRMDEWRSVVLPIPTREEQQAVIVFLDRETAKIDELVAKKERLIELLQEKRTALITRAVTRGLDPDVQMKDSGVEWLGEIPAHWEVKPLKRAVDYVEGPGIMASDFQSDGVPLLRISGIGGRIATLEGCQYLSPETVQDRWQHFRVRIGDLLISGSASTGLCTEVDEATAGSVPYTGIIIVRPREGEVSKDFSRWILLSSMFAIQTDLARSGSTIQHFGPSHLGKMFVLLPPPREQEAIATYLDSETLRIDRVVRRVRDAIDILTEFRTALISAAVTGKIDVRCEA